MLCGFKRKFIGNYGNMSDIAPRDKNRVAALLGTSNVDGESTVKIYADPTTHRLFVESSGGAGASIQTDVFIATSGQTVFTATQNVAGTYYISVNGNIATPTNQDPSGYYTVSGDTATFSSGQIVGSVILWCYATS
jgi:hypothetical protein